MKNPMKKRSGSALVSVLLFSFTITLLMFDLWRKTSLSNDVIIARREHHFHSHLINAVFSYGLTLVKTNAEAFRQKQVLEKMPITLNLSFLVQKLVSCYAWRQQDYEAFITIALRKEGDFYCEAGLEHHKKLVRVARGILSQTKAGNFFLDYYTERACI